MGDRSESNRQAIEASMETGGGDSRELIRDANAIVVALAELKRLKSEYLESEQDEAVGHRLTALNERVKASIEAVMETDLVAAQKLVARGYKEFAFDPVDLHEMGFSDEDKNALSTKMAE